MVPRYKLMISSPRWFVEVEWAVFCCIVYSRWMMMSVPRAYSSIVDVDRVLHVMSQV
jgi:hypothetical protein